MISATGSREGHLRHWPVLRWRTRPAELILLGAAAALAVACQVALALASGAAATSELSPAVALVASFMALHLVLSWRGSRADQVILPTLLALMSVGLAFAQRLAPALATRHFAWLILGVAVAGFFAVGPIGLRLLRRYRYTWAIIGVVLVAATLVLGRGPAPDAPRLWLGVGRWQFQPSEVLKLLLVVFLAGYLADRGALLRGTSTRLGRVRVPPVPYLAPLAVMLGASLVLLAAQRDLGAALLLYAIGVGMLYLASGKGSYVVAGLVAFAIGAWALQGHVDVVRVRTAVWRDPWADASGAGYQLVQSTMALGAGGVLGTGLGEGQPTAIPAVHTDFVYAAVVEELGLAGSSALLGLYAVLYIRGWMVAMRARDAYAGYLSAGLTMALWIQTVVIVGGILRLFPITGITLPFLAYGGTSMITSSAAAGLLVRVSGGGTR